jgi:hypothetical protein
MAIPSTARAKSIGSNSQRRLAAASQASRTVHSLDVELLNCECCHTSGVVGKVVWFIKVCW